MVRRRRPPHWHLALTIAGLAAVVAGTLYLGRSGGGEELPPALDRIAPAATPVAHPDPGSFALALLADTDSVMAALGIGTGAVNAQTGVDSLDLVTVHVPADLPLASVNLHLTRLVQWHGGYVARGEELGSGGVDLLCGVDSTLTTRFRLRRDAGVRRRTGRIALIVDASGETGSSRLRRLLALPQPLTVIGGATGPADAAPHQLLTSVPSVGDSIAGASAADVRRQLWALAERAADEGQAVAIAAAGEPTLQALELLLPRLETRGYRFVTLAELQP